MSDTNRQYRYWGNGNKTEDQIKLEHTWDCLLGLAIDQYYVGAHKNEEGKYVLEEIDSDTLEQRENKWLECKLDPNQKGLFSTLSSPKHVHAVTTRLDELFTDLLTCPRLWGLEQLLAKILYGDIVDYCAKHEYGIYGDQEYVRPEYNEIYKQARHQEDAYYQIPLSFGLNRMSPYLSRKRTTEIYAHGIWDFINDKVVLECKDYTKVWLKQILRKFCVDDIIDIGNVIHYDSENKPITDRPMIKVNPNSIITADSDIDHMQRKFLRENGFDEPDNPNYDTLKVDIQCIAYKLQPPRDKYGMPIDTTGINWREKIDHINMYTRLL